MPPTTRRLLDNLSPESRLGRVRAPLFLVHGRQDPAVPFTESLSLAEAARAAGRPVRATVRHVDPEERAGWVDLLRLWATFYSFRVTAGWAPRALGVAPAPVGPTYLERPWFRD